MKLIESSTSICYCYQRIQAIDSENELCWGNLLITLILSLSQSKTVKFVHYLEWLFSRNSKHIK